MAMLARAILRELPEYEMYWHIPAIKFGRRVMRNTNGLLGRYADADGMKTGFICASGFNVVASATRNGRKLIVVVFGSRSGAVRSEKAAQLFEKGFNSGGLTWLMPALGTVDALQPIAAAPPNLRDEMCGRNRKRPAAEESDDDETVQAGTDVDPSSAYAVTMQNLRGRPATGPLLGPYAMLTPPMPVYIGAPRPGSDAATQIAVARPARSIRKKQPTTAIAVAPAAAPKVDAKPATVNASAGGFNLTPSIKLPGIGSFTPASAESKPAPAPEAAPAKKEAAPAAKPKKTAAKPAAKQAAKPEPKSTKQ
jgi:D-alanyl-D-alanine carboxypeptidase